MLNGRGVKKFQFGLFGVIIAREISRFLSTLVNVANWYGSESFQMDWTKLIDPNKININAK